MAINSQSLAIIGTTAFEMAQALFAKLETFNNLTGEGVVVENNNVYEYFAMTLGEDAYRIRVQYREYRNNFYFNFGFATEYDSGGSCSLDMELNHAYTTNDFITPTNQGYNSPKKYAYVRLFTNTGNDFIGLSAWHITTSKNAPVSLIVNCDAKRHVLYPGGGYIYGLSSEELGYSKEITTDSAYDGFYESIDSVFLEKAYANVEGLPYPVDDLYHIWNNQLYTYNQDHDTNGFIIIGTEKGNYMAIYKDLWLKYGKTIGSEVYEYGV